MTQSVIRLLQGNDFLKGMKPTNFIANEHFTTSDQKEIGHTFYEAPNQSVVVGVWEGAPCREEVDAWPDNELMIILLGSVSITDQDGHAQTFTKGDTCFVAKGTRCVWENTETLRKFYILAD